MKSLKKEGIKMKKLPKKCLTCIHMEFFDDDCNLLMCTDPSSEYEGLYVDDNFVCDLWMLNPNIEEDAKQGCW